MSPWLSMEKILPGSGLHLGRMARFAPRWPLGRRLQRRRVRRRCRVRRVRRRLGHRGVRLAAAWGLGACLRQKLAPVEKIHP